MLVDFHSVATAKFLPAGGIVAEPFPQRSAGRDVLDPFINGRVDLLHSAGFKLPWRSEVCGVLRSPYCIAFWASSNCILAWPVSTWSAVTFAAAPVVCAAPPCVATA